jgi:GDPmannose 4,6-dehydratase
MDWQKYVEIDSRYLRPSEVDYLQGDASKAKRILKWESKVTFKELAKLMTDADMKIAENEKIIKNH